MVNLTHLIPVILIKKSQLNSGRCSVMYWNTTSSPDVLYTASHVFEHVTKYKNFVAASDSPFNLTQEERKTNFYKYLSNGDSVFTQNNNSEILNRFLATPLTDIRDSILKLNLWLITDNNMATEYKAGVWQKPLFLSELESKRAK